MRALPGANIIPYEHLYITFARNFFHYLLFTLRTSVYEPFANEIYPLWTFCIRAVADTMLIPCKLDLILASVTRCDVWFMCFDTSVCKTWCSDILCFSFPASRADGQPSGQPNGDTDHQEQQQETAQQRQTADRWAGVATWYPRMTWALRRWFPDSFSCEMWFYYH